MTTPNHLMVIFFQDNNSNRSCIYFCNANLKFNVNLLLHSERVWELERLLFVVGIDSELEFGIVRAVRRTKRDDQQ